MPEGAAQGLAGWVQGRFEAYKRQRSTLTNKWENNRRAFQCLDPETGKRWKPKSEAQRDWHSIYVTDVARTKTITAHSIVAESMFKGGGINFMLAPDDDHLEAQDVQAPAGNQDESAARASAIDTRTRMIRRQLDACDAEGVLDAALLLAAEYGESYIRTFFHVVETDALVRGMDGVAELVTQSETMPAIMVRPPQAIFRDLRQDDLTKGEGLIDRDEIDLPTLRKWAKAPMYDAELVKRVLEKLDQPGAGGGTTGASETSSDSSSDARTPRQTAVQGEANGVEVLEYWGLARVSDIRNHVTARNGDGGNVPAHYAKIIADLADMDGDDWAEITATVVSGKVLRLAYTKTPRARKFYRLVWERDPDALGGVGIPDKLLHHYVTMTGATRALEDNAKLLSNLLLLVKRHYLNTDLDQWEPGKAIDVSDDVTDARMAMVPVQFPNILGPIVTVLESFLSMADLSSMVPRVAQGQQTAEPQTLGELNSRLEQAGKYLAGVIRRADAAVEWIVNEHYRWIETDPDQPPAPFVFRAKALGFTSFENKVTRLTRLLQALRMTLESEDIRALSRLRPLVEEIYKAMDIDPEQILKSQRDLETEAAQRSEALASGTGGDPVERQKAAAEIARLNAEAQAIAARATLDEQRAGKIAEDRQIRKVEVVRQLTAPPAEAVQPAAPGPGAAA